ncbi:hypothetical protein QFC22_001287 [Naganishia vaughanmartiniae]|uniref:Uncharacterized protein n=1 Tax=Naganishia vaughanmartiniae TaxID=1424756 RepID=A0ACC2XGQ1_9TREE|nr:hypothetical protein QFC22_001287 [Naganishia vaughanmartiniae]
MSENNPFFIPKPDPSQFPPISQRLKPLIPFMIYWTALTSLAYNMLRLRTLKEEDAARSNAQISVLEGLVNRYRAASGMKTGTELDDQEVSWPDEAEVERELQMVGLRERRHAPDGATESLEFQEGRDVGWREVLFGRKRAKLSEEEEEKAAAKEWRDGEQIMDSITLPHVNHPLASLVIVSASQSSSPPSTQSTRSPTHPANMEPTSSGVHLTGTSNTKRAPSSAVFM